MCVPLRALCVVSVLFCVYSYAGSHLLPITRLYSKITAYVTPDCARTVVPIS